MHRKVVDGRHKRGGGGGTTGNWRYPLLAFNFFMNTLVSQSKKGQQPESGSVVSVLLGISQARLKAVYTCQLP